MAHLIYHPKILNKIYNYDLEWTNYLYKFFYSCTTKLNLNYYILFVCVSSIFLQQTIQLIKT